MRCPEYKGEHHPVYFVFFQDNYLHCAIGNICSNFYRIKIYKIPISKIREDSLDCELLFSNLVLTDDMIGRDSSSCSGCSFKWDCNLYQLASKHGSTKECYINIPLGFKFKRSDYKEVIAPFQSPKENENPEKQKSSIQLKEEETSMAKNEIKETTMAKNEIKERTLWDQLYRHAPEENVAIVKDWCRKYKSTLVWAIPVVGIYAAYRILKSKDSNITVDNINKINKKTGLNFKELKNKEALRQLMILGGVIAGGYALSKIIPKLKEKNGEETLNELNVEQLEATMDAAEQAKNKFGFLGPKAEALFPVATSVIIIYLMTQKPKWFEDLKAKVIEIGGNTYSKAKVFLDLAKAFIADKLHIDLQNEEELKKFKRFFILGAIVLVSVFVFGKKILGKDAEVEQDDAQKNEKMEAMEAFVSELTNIMKKLMPTAFSALVTILVTNKILKARNDQTSESEEDEENDEDDDESFGYIDRIVDPDDDLESEENMSSDSETEENNEDSSEDDEQE